MLVDPFLLLDNSVMVVCVPTMSWDLVVGVASELEFGSEDALYGKPFWVIRELERANDLLLGRCCGFDGEKLQKFLVRLAFA